jgi:hypothetical protein
VDVIDVTRSGTVSLTSTGDILGDADSSHRINAASTTFYASNGGSIGSVGNPIHLSSPIASFSPTGALNVESDTHIDRLGITVTHPAGYGGTYSIVSVPMSGAAYQLFTATDSVAGTALTSLTDPLGLAFSFTSDRAMQVGDLNLGQTGTVSLTGTSSGGILGDGDPTTQVQAASLTMSSLGGAVGATGSGNGIDATVASVSASALGGSVNLALHGRTALGSISGTGGVNLANDVGDIALGSINAGGNAVTINNQGGSILSGSIANATTVALTASGSIGNSSAINTSANGGGTTTLTASASAAHGASGSIALSESYTLAAASVTAPGAVTLSSSYGLSAGTVTGGGAVALSSSQGSITGIDGSNAITGSSVTLSARYGTGNGIGLVGTRLNVNTPQLTLNTPGSVYVTDSADLNKLTIDRTNYSGTGSSGTLSVIASSLAFSAGDTGNLTTISSLTDSTGLDFTYLGVGSLRVHDVNVGNGNMLLQASLSNGDGNITALNSGSLLTAGNLTLQAYGSGSNIGSGATPLKLAVGSVTASSGTGGIVLQQAGSLNLASLSTTGNLAVTATSGDLTLGGLSYGSSSTLSLTASGGSILAGTGTLTGGGASAAITLSAANGIGTASAPVLVNASAGHTVSASVTGNGSLYLGSTGTLNGGLSTAVHNGSTLITAASHIKLANMTSATDADGNDINVTASAGDITVGSVSGGSDARFNAVNLSANAGRILALPGATLQAYDVSLHGATGVGSSGQRVSASGQRVQVSSNGGAIYLTAAAPSVLSSVDSAGGLIDITTTADLLLANALSSGGAISVTSSTAGVDLIVGNLNAGSGSVTISTTGSNGTVSDDGNRNTRVAGGAVSLTGAGGLGTAQSTLQTTAATLTLSSGNGIYLDDNRGAGTTLASVIASNGAVAITAAGNTTATLVQATADANGNDVTLATSSGDLTVANISAGANHGAVNLTAAGSIIASGNGTHVAAHNASLDAGGDIGSTGAPLRLNVASLDSVFSGGAATLAAPGDLDVSTTSLNTGSLSLTAGGTLTLPATLSVAGAVALSGSTDVITSGGGRNLHVDASSLVLRSGAAGGSTQLTTSVGSLDAALTGAGNLTVNNTGTLASTTLATSNGDIGATSSTGLTAGSVVAGGSSRTVSLTATSGDLAVTTVNAGSNGTINLAAGGALDGTSATLTANALNLLSGQGIGSSSAGFATHAATVSAQVTGTGGIWLAPTGAVTLGALSTANGDISVAGNGNIQSGTSLSAGNGGNIALLSSGGDVTISHAITQAGNVTLQGQHVSLQAVSSSGAQSITGITTLNGDLSGSAIAVHGATTLAGGARSLQATGALVLDGALTGNGFAASLQGGSVSLGGTIGNVASLSVSGATTLTADTSIDSGNIGFAGSLDGAHALTLTSASGLISLGTVGSNTALSSLAVTGATQLAGNMTTSGLQSYGGSGALTLAGDLALNGLGVSFARSITGTHALTVNAGSGGASFSNSAAGTPPRIGALVVNSSGATSFHGDWRAASITTDAAGTLTVGGNIDTTGAQLWGERLVLGGTITLTGSSVTLAAGADAFNNNVQRLTIAGDAQVGGAIGAQHALGALTVTGGLSLLADETVRAAGAVTLGSIDGAHALTVEAGSIAINGAIGQATRLGALQLNSSGATTLGGTVRAASVTTDAAGTLALNGGSVDTTGAQSFGEHAVLGADTTLSGSSIALSGGADGAHALAIQGDAVIGGAITTTGDQHYGGAVQLVADTTLHSTGGALSFASTIDSATHANLTLASDTGAIALGGALGANEVLGALTVSAATTLDFSGSVQATQVNTTNVSGLTRFLGQLNAGNGIALSGGSFSFAQAVTSSAGALTVANTSANGTVSFAPTAAVNTATGFTQTGGAGVVLPASVYVQHGAISLEAPATLPSGVASIETEGSITLSGLSGPSTQLTLASGHGTGGIASLGAGALGVGLDDGIEAHRIDVAHLTVPDAASATLFGRINGNGGAYAASLIDSVFVNAPYFINATPWGPLEIINRLVATTVPTSVVPSTPSADTLFTQTVSPGGLAPNALGVYAAPQVLTMSSTPVEENERK